MRIPALVRNLDADLRLSRATGTIQILATHRLADFEAVGPAGSEEAAIARNLIGSCDTRICLAQDTAPLAATREAIGLTEAECAQISSFTGAHVGRAIWKIGRSFSVASQLLLTEQERRIAETNQRMKA
jgi:type IV secretory pathway VirB4 component